MKSAGSTMSVTPVRSARPDSRVRPKVVTMKAPKNGSSPSRGRPAVATTSTPMTRPSRAAAPASPQVATTLGANPAAKNATPTARIHGGQRGSDREISSSSRHASSGAGGCCSSPTRRRLRAATRSRRKMPGVARTTAVRPTWPDDRSVISTCSGRITRSTSTPYAEAAPDTARSSTSTPSALDSSASRATRTTTSNPRRAADPWAGTWALLMASRHVTRPWSSAPLGVHASRRE